MNTCACVCGLKNTTTTKNRRAGAWYVHEWHRKDTTKHRELKNQRYAGTYKASTQRCHLQRQYYAYDAGTGCRDETCTSRGESGTIFHALQVTSHSSQ